MKILLFLLTFSFALASYAKEVSQSDIVGTYDSVLVFEDGVWAIVGYGLLRGTWSLDKDTINFATTKEQLFRVYGRNLDEPEHPTTVRFINFKGREVSVNLNPKRKKSAKALFETNDSRPEDYSKAVYVQDKPIKKILLAQKEDAVPLEPEHTTFVFDNAQNYNDFLVIMPPPLMVNRQTFKAKVEGEGIRVVETDDSVTRGFYEEGKFIERSSLPKAETVRITHDFAINGLYPSQLLYVDSVAHYSDNMLSQEYYPYVDNPTIDNTQDYVELKPEISLEIIKQQRGFLISDQCLNDKSQKVCYDKK